LFVVFPLHPLSKLLLLSLFSVCLVLSLLVSSITLLLSVWRVSSLFVVSSFRI